MQPVSPSTSTSASKPRGLINKVKAAWIRGEQHADGNLICGTFFPNPAHPKAL